MTDAEFNIAEAFERGLTLIEDQQLAEAEAVFVDAIEKKPELHKSYVLYGTTRWLQGSPDHAKDAWIQSLKCSYQDPAMMETPLLLHALAIMYPHVHSPLESVKLLDERLASSRSNSWPGPIAAYLLEKISEPAMRQLISKESGKRRDSAECIYEFGTGLRHYGRGEFALAGNAWRRCIPRTSGTRHFSQIARYELSRKRELSEP